MKVYSKLWTKFKNMISVILSDLKKVGWLEGRLDPNDSRKRLYKLISSEEALKEIAKS
jgi:hypothetical protein